MNIKHIYIGGGIGLLLSVAAAYFALVAGGSKKPETTPTMHDMEYEVDGKAVAAVWNTHTGHIEELSNELNDRLADIAEKEAELAKREERIQNEMMELKRLQTEIEDSRALLSDMIITIEQNEIKNLRSQAKIYSEMDPTAAVDVFREMDDVEVVKLLFFMKETVKSELFNAMIEAGQPDPTNPMVETGAEKVAKLNDMLKFTQRPEKKAN